MYHVLIPAYNPPPALLDVVDGLRGGGKDIRFTVVDDGSDDPSSLDRLRLVGMQPDVTLLQHGSNRGKGAALKTGIAHLKAIGAPAVTTVDADGQHAPEDVLAVIRAAGASENMHIGTRNFGPRTPLRSRFGNRVTRWIFNVVAHHPVEDTQSGLRVIPGRYFDRLLAIPIDRYDFEFEALYEIARADRIIGIPIATLYEEGNPTSHFRPVLDSARIYCVLLRYVLVVPLITLIDFLGFLTVKTVLDPVTAFVSVRVVTFGLYFYVMRSLVFRSHGGITRQIVLAGLLCLANIVLSALIIDLVITALSLHAAVGYIIAATTFFVLNFLLQRFLIFPIPKN